MSIRRPEYFSNLRKSVNWKHQRWKENPICPTNSDVVSANKALASICHTGNLERARQVFDKMPDRTVVSWNTMITGYSKCNSFPTALGLISLMHHSNLKFNETTFSMSLSVCGRAQSLINGKQLHGLLFKSGYQRFKFVGSGLLYLYAFSCQIGDGRKVFDELYQENEFLWSLMLAGYVECNSMTEARSVFHQMPRRSVVDWTTLISGYVKSDVSCKKGLKVFKMMRENGEAAPNEFTLDCVVRGCGRMGDLWSGRVIHGLIIKFGFEGECRIGSALVFLYCSCESMDDAKNVCCYTSSQLVTDSNELIRGLLKLGNMKEAELIFSNMAEIDPSSYNLMIKGYARCGRAEDSERLFMQMPLKVLSSLNTMISVYARKGEVNKALELFEKAKLEGSPVSWNSMISGYIHNDQHENALKLYLTMCRSSINPTASTFAVLFHACACLGSLQQGRLLHAHLAKTPFSCNVFAGTALIDMYSKCGSIADARVAFSCVSSPSVAAWTALINGHSHHGLGSDAVSLFSLMLDREVTPNAATFVAVLSACARAGLVDKGMGFFQSMKEQYGITPTKEHLTCVVELLGRSGLLHEAEELIQSMPIETDKILLTTLLHACWSWMDVEVAERVAQKMLDLDPNTSAAGSVIMSNIYSRSGNWEQKLKARDALKEQGFKKDPGCSWIEINNRSHIFSVNCRNHPNSDMIYSTLESLKFNARST
ncbi:hypothetical protein C2S53_013083 [Perilla frutescens var. hirtella]|uniref:Pentatricopeptide repeat-containing protein n=1 Tax=Perilla frutescens var. hirtella TaxID=608512 RepID=A0AAD4J6M3_PERFH|nr:hypothetical protein C2S53_013083 [Perilla frutescens var. hirtella]